MGAVYLAEHPGIGRRVAVKVLHKNYTRDEHLLARFLNEARAANAIRHPNIIEILDSGMLADGTPFLVMELLEGESLGTRLRQNGALPIATAVDFAYQTASALGAAHAKGIVHRDLKPDNMFVVPDPHDAHRERVKVLDFGIAKLQQGSVADSVKTRTGHADGDADLHVARAVPRARGRSITAATSTRWASSSTRCWSASRRSCRRASAIWSTCTSTCRRRRRVRSGRRSRWRSTRWC